MNIPHPGNKGRKAIVELFRKPERKGVYTSNYRGRIFLQHLIKCGLKNAKFELDNWFIVLVLNYNSKISKYGILNYQNFRTS